jgi:hypothetical protein
MAFFPALHIVFYICLGKRKTAFFSFLIFRNKNESSFEKVSRRERFLKMFLALPTSEAGFEPAFVTLLFVACFSLLN